MVDERPMHTRTRSDPLLDLLHWPLVSPPGVPQLHNRAFGASR